MAAAKKTTKKKATPRKRSLPEFIVKRCNVCGYEGDGPYRSWTYNVVFEDAGHSSAECIGHLGKAVLNLTEEIEEIRSKVYHCSRLNSYCATCGY